MKNRVTLVIFVLIILVLGGIGIFWAETSNGFASINQSSLTYGLVGYFPMDEQNGIIAHDVSGNNNSGTLLNSVSWLGQSNCKFSGCLNFSGSTQIVNISSHVNFPTGNDSWTLSAWIYSYTTNCATSCVISDLTQKAYHDAVIQFTNNPAQLRLGLSGTGCNFALYLTAKIWTFVSIIYNSKNLTVTGYLNQNSATCSISQNPNISFTSNKTSIGNNGVKANPFHGSIDDFRIYNYSLSSQQESTLYKTIPLQYSVFYTPNGVCPSGQFVTNVSPSSIICATPSSQYFNYGSCSSGQFVNGITTTTLNCATALTTQTIETYGSCSSGQFVNGITTTTLNCATALTTQTVETYGTCSQWNYNNGITTTTLSCSPEGINQVLHQSQNQPITSASRTSSNYLKWVANANINYSFSAILFMTDSSVAGTVAFALAVDGGNIASFDFTLCASYSTSNVCVTAGGTLTPSFIIGTLNTVVILVHGWYSVGTNTASPATLQFASDGTNTLTLLRGSNLLVTQQ